MPFLIEQLERAAQPDDGLLSGEQSLKDILVNVNGVLRSADLANADSWKRISAMLAIREDAPHNDLPAIVVQRQNRRGSLS